MGGSLTASTEGGVAQGGVTTPPDPKFLIELKTTDPLQITITRTSIQLIKDLIEVGVAIINK